MPLTQITKNVNTDDYFDNEITSSLQGQTDYSYAEYKAEFDSLDQKWECENEKLKTMRRFRKIKVDVKTLRANKELALDETISPVRLMDENIRREVPTYVQYLLQSRRIAIFKPTTPGMKFMPELLETEFTRVFRHANWECEMIRLIDGKIFLGWDAMEIVVDDKAPGKFRLRHVGRENIRFNRKAINIQACAKVVVIYQLSAAQLKKFVAERGWKKSVVDALIEKKSESSGKGSCNDYIFDVRRVYFKTDKDEFIRVAWYCKDGDDWLSIPRPLFLGRTTKEIVQTVEIGLGLDGMPMLIPTEKEVVKNIYETEFPIYIATYMENEEKEILSKEGRSFLDEPKQEAATAIRSSIVNRAVRGANVYASPKNPTSVGTGIPKATTMTLKNGAIYDAPLEFWNMPSVDPALPKIDQMLQVNNAAETNKVAWAVNNREDSRKTATEIQSVTQKESEIDSVSVVLFSKFIRELTTRLWSIVQNLAANGNLPDFLSTATPEYRMAALSMKFDLFAAGDVDVIKRNEEINTMKQDWPVVSTIPQLAAIFLADYFRKAYATDGEKYASIVMSSMQQQGNMEALMMVLKGMLEQFGPQMTPEQQQNVAQLIGGMNAQPDGTSA